MTYAGSSRTFQLSKDTPTAAFPAAQLSGGNSNGNTGNAGDDKDENGDVTGADTAQNGIMQPPQSQIPGQWGAVSNAVRRR